MSEKIAAYKVKKTPARPSGTKKKPAPRPPSNLEELLVLHIRANGLPAANREYRFDMNRLWRFDFAWPDYKIEVECEGGTFTNGSHTRGEGYQKNCEKYNAAALSGWMILRYDMAMIKSGQAIQQIKFAIDLKKRGLTLP